MKDLVVLSGWASTQKMWQRFLKNLRSEFNIYLLTWNSISNLDDFYKNTNSIFRSIEGKFSIVAWSLGSLLAIRLEKEYRSKIDKIILLNPTCKFIRDMKSGYNIGWSKRVVNKMINEISIEKDKVINSFYKNMFSSEEIMHKNNFINKFSSDISNIESDSLILGLEFLIKEDCRFCLNDYNTKTLIIHGKEDRICSIDGGAYIHDRILNVSKMVKMDKGGHILFWTSEYLLTKEIFLIINS